MKKNLLFLLMILGLYLSSQTPSMNNLELNNLNVALIASSILPSKDVEGTIYIYPNFTSGRAIRSSVLHKLRYNALADEVEISKGDKVFNLNKTPNFPIEFVETNEVIVFSKYNYNNIKSEGYLFEVGGNEHFVIYKKAKIIFQPEVIAKTSFEASYPPKYKRVSDVYFIQKDNGEINELPESKQELIKMFSDKKEQINKNFKGRKINFSNISEVQKLLTIL